MEHFVARYSGPLDEKAISFFELGCKTTEYLCDNGFSPCLTDSGFEWQHREKEDTKIRIALDMSPENHTELHEIDVLGSLENTGPYVKSLIDMYKSCNFEIL